MRTLIIGVIFVAVAFVASGCGSAARHPLTISSPAASPSSTRPAWLGAEITQTLKISYESAKPTRIDTISYPRKITVVLTFAHTVICGGCSAPSSDQLPRGRILRISFHRLTHAPGDSLRFCDTRTACLSR